MTIPPGYENAVGHCTICGGVVSANQSPPASRIEETIHSAKPKPKPKLSDRIKEIQSAVLHGLVGGFLGALLCGTPMALFLIIKGQTGEHVTIGTVFASADTGILAGFVICSSWAVIRRLSLGPLMGMLIGGSVGFIMGALTYFLEKELVAPPDLPALAYAIIALVAGAVAGFIIGGKVGSPD
jgi:hypothetical protein